MRAAITPPRATDPLSDEFEPGASFDLDLPSHDPLARRVSSGGLPAVLPPSEPPPPNSFRTPLPIRSSYPPPAVHTTSAPPVGLSASPPPVNSAAQARASVPPVSRAPAPSVTGGPLPPSPRFALKLSPSPQASLFQRLLPGGLVLTGAVLLTILDQVYSSVSGEVFTIGPLRTSVIAGMLMLVGVALCLYRLKRD